MRLATFICQLLIESRQSYRWMLLILTFSYKEKITVFEKCIEFNLLSVIGESHKRFCSSSSSPEFWQLLFGIVCQIIIRNFKRKEVKLAVSVGTHHAESTSPKIQLNTLAMYFKYPMHMKLRGIFRPTILPRTESFTPYFQHVVS